MNFARRIVIDTGLLVSAAIRPESIPALALEKAWLQFDVCTSDETWAELQDVLIRPKFDLYVTPELRRTFLQGFRQRTLSFSTNAPPERWTSMSMLWCRMRTISIRSSSAWR